MMLGLPASVRVLLCLQPADMRRSFDGLCALVVGVLEENPASGHLFIFRNKRGDRLKALWFDRDGLAIYYKRLEKGVFRFPSLADGGRGDPSARLEISARELSMILSGLEHKQIRKLRRYSGACR
jgi:transposase